MNRAFANALDRMRAPLCAVVCLGQMESAHELHRQLAEFVERATFFECYVRASSEDLKSRLHRALTAVGWSDPTTRERLVRDVGDWVLNWFEASGAAEIEVIIGRYHGGRPGWHVDFSGIEQDLDTPTLNLFCTLSGTAGTRFVDGRRAEASGVLGLLWTGQFDFDPEKRRRANISAERILEDMPADQAEPGEVLLFKTGYREGLVHAAPPPSGMRLTLKVRAFCRRSGMYLAEEAYQDLVGNLGYAVYA